MMHTFAALDSKHELIGPWRNCVAWAVARVQANHTRVIHIARLRPKDGGGNGLIVAEVSQHGLRWLNDVPPRHRHQLTTKEARRFRRGRDGR